MDFTSTKRVVDKVKICVVYLHALGKLYNSRFLFTGPSFSITQFLFSSIVNYFSILLGRHADNQPSVRDGFFPTRIYILQWIERATWLMAIIYRGTSWMPQLGYVMLVSIDFLYMGWFISALLVKLIPRLGQPPVTINGIHNQDVAAMEARAKRDLQIILLALLQPRKSEEKIRRAITESPIFGPSISLVMKSFEFISNDVPKHQELNSISDDETVNVIPSISNEEIDGRGEEDKERKLPCLETRETVAEYVAETVSEAESESEWETDIEAEGEHNLETRETISESESESEWETDIEAEGEHNLETRETVAEYVAETISESESDWETDIEAEGEHYLETRETVAQYVAETIPEVESESEWETDTEAEVAERNLETREIVAEYVAERGSESEGETDTKVEGEHNLENQVKDTEMESETEAENRPPQQATKTDAFAEDPEIDQSAEYLRSEYASEFDYLQPQETETEKYLLPQGTGADPFTQQLGSEYAYAGMIQNDASRDMWTSSTRVCCHENQLLRIRIDEILALTEAHNTYWITELTRISNSHKVERINWEEEKQKIMKKLASSESLVISGEELAREQKVRLLELEETNNDLSTELSLATVLSKVALRVLQEKVEKCSELEESRDDLSTKLCGMSAMSEFNERLLRVREEECKKLEKEKSELFYLVEKYSDEKMENFMKFEQEKSELKAKLSAALASSALYCELLHDYGR